MSLFRCVSRESLATNRHPRFPVSRHILPLKSPIAATYPWPSRCILPLKTSTRSSSWRHRSQFDTHRYLAAPEPREHDSLRNEPAANPPTNWATAIVAKLHPGDCPMPNPVTALTAQCRDTSSTIPAGNLRWSYSSLPSCAQTQTAEQPSSRAAERPGRQESSR